MPSIFIWKADIPNTSKQFIRYYAGSNWFLEDNDYTSNSYKYLQQIVIPGSDNNSVITFHVKKMPLDWVGTELLEVNQIPYRLICSDSYATLEHIGNWMRCIVHHPIEYTVENLTREYNNVMKWKENASSSQSVTPLHQTNVSTTRQKTQHSKAPYPSYNSGNRHPVHKHHMNPSYHRNNPHPTPVSLTPMVDSRLVQQQFQEFMQKFNVPTVLHTGIPQNMQSIPLVSVNRSMMFKYS
jgi:hypothetical protein